jgi:glycosyltransferase involved in cell wall biosynthesis
VEIPFGIYLEDLHNLNNVEERIEKDKINHIFVSYRDHFITNFPNLAGKMKWLPHHVNTAIFKDYHLSKDIKMLMMGAVYEYYYPIRHKILQTLSGNIDFVYHPHPGYRDINETDGDFVKEKYAMEINKAQLFFTCDSIYKYPLLKYMEVLACNTLLLAPDSPELQDLGFRSEENFVAIDEENFLEKAGFYLKNEQERRRIANNGLNLIQERHTTAIRAKELLGMISSII